MTYAYTVGVVIPTLGRPSILRAVRSVMDQTLKPLDIVVVFDGSEEDARESAAHNLPDGVTLLCTGLKTNGNHARNVGIRFLDTDLVAFLDDDDSWDSVMLERQMQYAGDLSHNWLLTCSVRVTSQENDEILGIWPGRGPKEAEPIGDYFFRRRRLKQAPHFLQTSTWIGPRRVFLHMPFDERIRVHQDWDWLIRAQDQMDLRVIHNDEALVHYTSNVTNSASSAKRFEESRAWALDPDLPLSPVARGDFIAHMLLLRGLREHRYQDAAGLLGLSWKVGKPSLWALLGAVLRLARYRMSHYTSQR